MSVTRVNFDPAAEYLPYSPDVDVREYLNVRDVMEKYNLGPNGALIAAIDMLINYVADLKDEIESLNSNYVLIDMPGQLEIVTFRRVGPLLIDYLTRGRKSVTVFLVDSYLALNQLSMISLLLLSISSLLRIKKPQIIALTKIDLLTEDQELRLMNMFEYESSCSDVLESDVIDSELLARLCDVIKDFAGNIVPVSAVSGKGLDDLYASIQLTLGGGEDYLTEEPSGKL